MKPPEVETKDTPPVFNTEAIMTQGLESSFDLLIRGVKKAQSEPSDSRIKILTRIRNYIAHVSNVTGSGTDVFSSSGADIITIFNILCIETYLSDSIIYKKSEDLTDAMIAIVDVEINQLSADEYLFKDKIIVNVVEKVLKDPDLVERTLLGMSLPKRVSYCRRFGMNDSRFRSVSVLISQLSKEKGALNPSLIIVKV